MRTTGTVAGVGRGGINIWRTRRSAAAQHPARTLPPAVTTKEHRKPAATRAGVSATTQPEDTGPTAGPGPAPAPALAAPAAAAAAAAVAVAVAVTLAPVPAPVLVPVLAGSRTAATAGSGVGRHTTVVALEAVGVAERTAGVAARDSPGGKGAVTTGVVAVAAATDPTPAH